MRLFYSITLIMSFLIGFSQQKPNILVVIIDDAGFNDFGFQQLLGAEKGWGEYMRPADIYDFQTNTSLTPNIDALAATGTVFSRGYVTNSVCAASRAGLITGRYQNRFGYEYNLVKWKMAPDGNGGFLSQDEAGVDASEVTIAEHLKTVGYETSCIGKWHLGEEAVHHPNAQGFDKFYGLIKGSRAYWKGTVTERYEKIEYNGTVVESELLETDYLTDVFTTKSQQIIGEANNAGKPFFQYLSYTTPHGPFDSKEDDYNALAGCENCDGSAWTKYQDNTDHRQEYLSMQKTLDDNIGNLMTYLENTTQKDSNGNDIPETSLRDNTLIFFINDNGGPNSKPPKNNPLFGGKSSFQEGSLRVPFFVSWPNNIPSGTYDHQVISLDILSTAVTAAGLDYSSFSKPVDGVDLVSKINSNSVAHNLLYWRKLDVWSVISNNEGKKLIVEHNTPNDDTDDVYSFYDLSYSDREAPKNNRFNLHASELELFKSSNTDKAIELIDAYNSWNDELSLPDYMEDSICQNVYGCTDVENCTEILNRYNGTGNEVQPLNLQVSELSECFYVNDESVKKYGDAASELIECDDAGNGYYLKPQSFSANYIEIENITTSINATSANLKLYFFAPTDSDKTIDIDINGVNFKNDFNIGAGNGWCYEKKESVFVVLENVPFDLSGPNTIKFYNTPALEKIVVESQFNLTSDNKVLSNLVVYPSFLNSDEIDHINVLNRGELKGEFKFRITDLTGKKLYSTKLNSNKEELILTTKYFTKGLNFIEIENNGNKTVKKILIE